MLFWNDPSDALIHTNNLTSPRHNYLIVLFYEFSMHSFLSRSWSFIRWTAEIY